MQLGIDRIGEFSELFDRKRIGLITSVSGIDSSLKSSITAFLERYRLTALFGPEHGIMGERPAGEKVSAYTDYRSGLPVYSLYGEDRHLREEWIRELDVLVYDIQDIGVRYYTYISTLKYLMEDCERYDLPLVVLDRPNPLGGTAVEGNLAKEKYFSFVGSYDICIRHGMTVGELARMFQAEQYQSCKLSVIACEGWERTMQHPETGKLWIPPSPNIPDFETALLYSGTCLIEGTNLSEGRGTAKPFSYIGAPFVPAEELAERMNQEKITGAAFTPVYFTPTFSKQEGKLCGGVHIHVTDRRELRPVELGIRLFGQLQKLCGSDMEILPPPREGGRSFLSLLCGDDILLRADWNAEAVLAAMERESVEFTARKQEYHIY